MFTKIKLVFYWNWLLIKPYLRPSIIVSFGIAWLLTNGWAYILAAVGSGALRSLAVGYLALIWLPSTPEKIITIPLALLIQKTLFKKKRFPFGSIV